MPTLLRDLITIPEFVAKGDFVLKLTEGTDPAKVKATLDSYVVTPQLAACFDESLKLVQSALKGSSKAAYLHGSFGSGKSHFMAVLNFLLGGNVDARSIKELDLFCDRPRFSYRLTGSDYNEPLGFPERPLALGFPIVFHRKFSAIQEAVASLSSQSLR